jgi:hypothetical protein
MMASWAYSAASAPQSFALTADAYDAFAALIVARSASLKAGGAGAWQAENMRAMSIRAEI